jgi:hypothetical protein
MRIIIRKTLHILLKIMDSYFVNVFFGGGGMLVKSEYLLHSCDRIIIRRMHGRTHDDIGGI